MGLADHALHAAAAVGVLTGELNRQSSAIRQAAELAGRKRAPRATSPPTGDLEEDIRRGRASAALKTLRRRVPTPRR